MPIQASDVHKAMLPVINLITNTTVYDENRLRLIEIYNMLKTIKESLPPPPPENILRIDTPCPCGRCD